MQPIRMTNSKILDGQITLIDVEGINTPFIVLNEGKYSGVKYSYGEVKFGDEVNGGVNISFQYQVHVDADHDVTTDDFRNYIGEILSYLISMAAAASSGNPEDSADWDNFRLS